MHLPPRDLIGNVMSLLNVSSSKLFPDPRIPVRADAEQSSDNGISVQPWLLDPFELFPSETSLQRFMSSWQT